MPNLHTLILEYPAAELLPDGNSSPLLEPPTLLQQREAPPKDLTMAGIHDTTFFARLPVQPLNPFAVAPVANTHNGLLSAIEAAVTMPGRTKLQMVSFRDPGGTGDSLHRFRLHTELPGARTSYQDFQLDDSQWCSLLKHSRTTWIRLLNHLIQRMSARAYYHVRSQLIKAYGEEAADAEEAAWAGEWHSQPSRSAQELLFARLFPEEAEGAQSLLDGGDRTLLMTPACGHQTMVRKISLLALDGRACSMFACPVCDERVLQPVDDNELLLRSICMRAQTFTANNASWMTLDQDIEDNSDYIWVPAISIMCALNGALGSLKAEMLISPPEMSFIGLIETKLVFAELEEKFGDGDQLVTGSVSGLWDELTDSMSALLENKLPAAALEDGALPPGWIEDIGRMTTRTMRLVSDRQCTICNPRHAGLHKHGDKFFVGVLSTYDYTQATDDDGVGVEEEAEAVTSMDELSRLMGGTELG